MNKKELLKAIEQKRQEIWPTDTGEMKPATVPNNLELGWLNALTWMENLINSLPAEQLSEDLEEEIEDYFSYWLIDPQVKNQFHNIARHFANWQKEQMMKGFCFETKVYQDCDGDDVESPFQTWLSLEQNEITALPSLGLSDGNKVKVIIIKESE